ncbi:hypothetical protein [Sphingomonas sp.]|uniref:hypothetical protein n=1 Tax=Sphingomonas sp. TaxID=28214 RepID=UPI00307E8CA8
MNRATIALGVAAGGVVLALTALPAARAVEALQRARQTHAALAADLAAPPRAPVPIVAPGLAVAARDAAQARVLMARQIRSAAAAGGVLVERLDPAPSGAGVAAVALRLSGPEKAVVALVDRIERNAPLTRFRSWKISALANGGVRVEGELVAAWQ